MKKLNWTSFELKHDSNVNEAFERMTYALFCNRFNLENGLMALKNQIGIETEPVEVNGQMFGFQSKYLEPATKFNIKKKAFIDTLIKAKRKNPEINTIFFYVNKAYSEPTKGSTKHPQYIIEIEEKAKELDLKIEWQFPSQIQKQLSNPDNLRIAKEFFPEYVEKNSLEFQKGSKEYYLDISRTAMIQIEIAKITNGFTSHWTKDKDYFNQFYSFVDFRNEIIAEQIFRFLLQSVSTANRLFMNSSVAWSVHSLVITYFPSSYNEEESKLRIENGIDCVYIGFNLSCYALLRANDFRTAELGLNILKYVYREAKRKEYKELIKLVEERYEELERILDRPERNDLENAKKLVRIFKEDIENSSLAFPALPERLYALVLESDKSSKL